MFLLPWEDREVREDNPKVRLETFCFLLLTRTPFRARVTRRFKTSSLASLSSHGPSQAIDLQRLPPAPLTGNVLPLTAIVLPVLPLLLVIGVRGRGVRAKRAAMHVLNCVLPTGGKWLCKAQAVILADRGFALNDR